MANTQEIEIVINGKSYVAKATNQAKDDLKGLEKQAKDTNSAIKTIATGTALGNLATNVGKFIGELCVESFKAFTTGAYEASRAYSASVNDIMDKTGMTDEVASKWVSLGKIAGVSAQDLGSAIMVMSRNLQTNEENFSKWGIATRDANGELLNSEIVLENVLAKHREMANGIEKNTMEMELFGKAGGKFNDLLNLSEGTLSEWNTLLEANGNILRNNVSQAMEDTEQKGRLLDSCFDGLQIQIGQALNPALDTFYTILLDDYKAMYSNEQASKDLQQALEGLRDFAIDCANGIGVIVVALKDAVIWTAKFIQETNKATKVKLNAMGGGYDIGMPYQDDDVNPNIARSGWGQYSLSSITSIDRTPSRYSLYTPTVKGGGKSATEKEVDNTNKLTQAKDKLYNLEKTLMGKLGMEKELQDLQFTEWQKVIDDLKANYQDLDFTNVQDLLDKTKAKLSEVKEEIKDTTSGFQMSWSDAMKVTQDCFTSFGNNVLSASQSFSSALRNLFKSLANSLLSMAMNKAIGGLFSSFGSSSGAGLGLSSLNTNSISGINLSGIGVKADGGKTQGWTVVGEHGPELVNFTNPSRVYTAQQTSNLLNGNGTNNVKVIIENRSGQNVQATQAQTSFDAEGMILSIVLDASANNTDGFGMALGGALAGWSR